MRKLFAAILLLAAIPFCRAADDNEYKNAPDFSPVHRQLDEAVAQNIVAGGCILVLHRGKVVLNKGFGFADVESKLAFQADTPVVIASISKPLLGTLAFRLAEKGKLNLSKPISEYLPEFENRKLESGEDLKRAPTMTELFTHTSGMRNDDAPGGRPWFDSWVKGKTLAEVVQKTARDFPFKSQPGAKYAYSGIGTDVAARVIEVTSSHSRNEVFSAEVALPLGMTHTFYRDAVNIVSVGSMPTRYTLTGDGTLKVTKNPLPPPPNIYCASGGSIVSTAPDLARWLLMIRNSGKHEDKVFLPPDAVAEMISRVPGSYNARGGLFIREKDDAGKAVLLSHTGSSGTNCWIDFKHDIIGIVFTQTPNKSFQIDLQKRVTECVAK